MKIEVSGQREAGLVGSSDFFKTVTVTIEYNPEIDSEFSGQATHSDGRSYQELTGFAIKKKDFFGWFELVLFHTKQGDYTSITIPIGGIKKVVCGGQEVPQQDWLSVSFRPE